MNPTDKPNLPDLRVSYDLGELDEHSAPTDPVELFTLWINDALAHKLPEPNAMSLATNGLDGMPTVRTVLLKGIDERGFHFYTNYESRKGHEIEADARGAACFLWAGRHHQVCIKGAISKLERADAESYFASRPYGHQIGAWVSDQSVEIPGREWLEERDAELRAQFAEGEVPCPPHWGGYTLLPGEIEFWQGRVSRLHDRIRYRREGGVWVKVRLSP
ncbi:MAG: Pyridoxamine 5-phosphate oxidase [Prosthecobacter sp.]|nr:Pyridoxamine 5-phosphate oxidase [Prosthecobacter sp.]